MRHTDLRGVTVATVLPFDANSVIDWKSFSRLLDYCAVPDTTVAVFVNGHAGEGTALLPEERTQVIRHTRNVIGTTKPLLAGVTASSISEAIHQARAAEDAGADCIVVFPPESLGGGASQTPEAPVAFFRAITDAVSIPASVFQYPLASGLGYSTAALTEIARLEKVIAVKDGSGTILAYEENFRALRASAPDVAMLPSNFHWFLAQLAVGADGLLSGLASLTPAWLLDLWQAAEAGDLAEMRMTSDRLYPIVRAIYGSPPIIDMHSRIKIGLQSLGVIDNATPRLPLMPVKPEIAKRVVSAVKPLDPARFS